MYFAIGSSILLLMGCLAIWLLKNYIKAKRLHNYYSDVLKKSGLNYKIFPFNFFSISFLKLKNEAYQKYGDCYYLRKTESSKIDIQLHNIFDKIGINLAKPDLLKEFYSQDKVYIYQKESRPIEAIKIIFGHGIAFSEGNIWKQKRKAFSKVFNYDLIKANIPKVVALCDKCLDGYEK